MLSVQSRRPVSSYEPAFLGSSIEDSPRFKLPRANRAPTFDCSKSNMDSVCSKMAESIIFSSDTLDSLTEVSAPLSVDQFDKIRFLGQGKFGQVHLVK